MVITDIATVMGYLSIQGPFLNLSHPRHMHSTHNEIMAVRSNTFFVMYVCVKEC